MKIHRYHPRDELVPMDVDAALARARDHLASTRSNPDALPLTRNQCTAHVAHMEALKAQQERGPNERIFRLLETPGDVLSDSEQWPSADDLGDAGVQATDAYRTWLLERTTLAGGQWEDAARWLRVRDTSRQDDPHTRALQWLLRHATMPFPVGTSCPELRDGYPATTARELMPFDDDGYAALVVPLLASDRRSTLFFMARQVRYEVLLEGEWLPQPGPGDVAEPGLPVWVIDGHEVRVIPPIPRVHLEMIRNARTWWKTLAGLRIEPGRPKGSRERTARDVIDKLRAYKALHGPIPPSRDEFLADCVGIEPTQWQRLKDDWAIDWRDLREAVYGSTTRKRAYTDHGL